MLGRDCESYIKLMAWYTNKQHREVIDDTWGLGRASPFLTKCLL